jgi:8-oxo-dGTP diphosphatase
LVTKRIQEHPLGFNLLPDKFSLRELQNLYEAILGVELDRRNFRKKFASMDLLIDVGEMEEDVPHPWENCTNLTLPSTKKKKKMDWN